MKTSQSPSHGLAKFSRLRQSSKNNDTYVSSSKNTEHISKYFTKKNSKEEDEDDMSTSEFPESLDSPYKNSLTYNKYIPPVDDASDFKTPKPFRTISKILKPSGGSVLNKQNKIKKSKSKNTKNKNCILKICKDNFGQTDVNPDHLQMALALSKSTYQLENPQMPKDTEEDLPCFLSRQKIAKVKTTLEKYGFKSDKSKIKPDRNRDLIEVPKKHKSSKFRFVTPILKMRTPEDREAIINSKISLIINQNSKPPTKESLNSHNENELFSDILKKYCKGSIIFRANRLTLEQTVDLDYYSKNLNITPTKYQCGHLLKKWEEIPGRDKSPVRVIVHHSEVSKDCNKILANSENLCSKEIDIRDINIDCQNLSTNKEDTFCEINSASVAVCNKKTELAIDLSGQNTPDRNCISPDLFASEDETDFALNTPETKNVLSQSLLNLSPSKSPGLLRPNKSMLDNSQSESFQRKKLVLSKKNIFKNNQGIEHFESYDDDFNQLSQEIYNLISSEDESTEDLYLSSVKNNKATAVRHDLTQRSTLNNITHDKQPAVYDLTLSSSSDEGTNDQFEFMENYENNEQPGDLIDDLIKEKCSAHVSLRETESHFDMSALHVKESNELAQHTGLITNAKLLPQQKSLNFESIEVYPAVKSPYKICGSPLSSRNDRADNEIEELNFDSTKMLNVTDYVMQILNKTNEGTTVNVDECIDNENYNNNRKYCDIYEKSLSRYSKTDHSNREIRDENFMDGDNHILDNGRENSDTSQDNEINLTQESLSQESIVISDEELNYSSVYSTGKTNDKYFYNLSEAEEIEENKIDDYMDIKEVGVVHSVLKAKYEDQCIPEPVHNRITELKQKSPLFRKSRDKVFLEDSFNDALEDTNILEIIESGAKSNEIQKNRKPTGDFTNNNVEHDNITPEKCNIRIMPSIANSVVTPENNLIIKTTDITPMANYDEMDTPKITKELHQFGLKPLKRQRGAKLLKYIYECTHPMVGPKEIEELSSDEDDCRKFKKRKEFNIPIDNEIDCTPLEQDNCSRDEGTVDIVGDLLLENENFEDLIFERKYSVKIPSCRIPLQIAWHNFISKNLDIKENILLYEPLQLEVLHSLLKEQSGCKFHIQDLLTFFDRKCITIRTAQTQGRRARK